MADMMLDVAKKNPDEFDSDALEAWKQDLIEKIKIMTIILRLI